MNAWVPRLRRCLSSAAATELQVDAFENRILATVPTAELGRTLSAIPASARTFFAQLYADCGGLNLPDVRNGYFVAAPSRLRNKLLNRSPLDPRMLRSDGGAELVCFGSDGGGGQLAYRTGECVGVWYLPVGEVRGGVFDDLRVPIRRVANTALELGEYLLSEVEAFIEGRYDWKYLGD